MGTMNKTHKKKDIVNKLFEIAEGRKINIGFDKNTLPDKIYLLV
jgi:hypothetical protein